MLLCLAALFPTSFLTAQPRDLPQVESKHFKRVLEYHDPPHERQMKYMLEGASAHTLPDGKLLITDGRVQAFTPTGELQAIGEAPEGIYDSKTRVVYSSGPCKAWTLDGTYYGEGRGYLWQMTNSLLFITNHERVDFADIAKKR